MTTPALLRSGVGSLTALASRDLSVLWRDLERAVDAEVALRDVLPGLIQVYGAAARALAAQWYDELREKSEVRGQFTAVVAAGAAPGRDPYGAQALVGWALTEVREPTDVSAFRSLVEGGMQRRIANVARSTVMGSSIADPAADGWQRVARPDGCGFCQMIASRGAVYRSESTADFGSHDWCGCVAQPAWGGQERPVKPYVPSSRNISDADRARVREWIATHDL